MVIAQFRTFYSLCMTTGSCTGSYNIPRVQAKLHVECSEITSGGACVGILCIDKIGKISIVFIWCAHLSYCAFIDSWEEM